MKNIYFGFLVIILFSGSTYKKPCLCKENEENIFSFATSGSKKSLSICVEKTSKYILYRFGSPEKIELQFPEKMNKTSWDQFTYTGYRRGGGPQNLAMSDQSLSFANKEASYEVYDQWAYEDTTQGSFSRETGIRIVVNGKEFNSNADLNTLSGSLENLTQYTMIKNKSEQE